LALLLARDPQMRSQHLPRSPRRTPVPRSWTDWARRWERDRWCAVALAASSQLSAVSDAPGLRLQHLQHRDLRLPGHDLRNLDLWNYDLPSHALQSHALPSHARRNCHPPWALRLLPNKRSRCPGRRPRPRPSRRRSVWHQPVWRGAQCHSLSDHRRTKWQISIACMLRPPRPDRQRSPRAEVPMRP